MKRVLSWATLGAEAKGEGKRGVGTAASSGSKGKSGVGAAASSGSKDGSSGVLDSYGSKGKSGVGAAASYGTSEGKGGGDRVGAADSYGSEGKGKQKGKDEPKKDGKDTPTWVNDWAHPCWCWMEEEQEWWVDMSKLP